MVNKTVFNKDMSDSRIDEGRKEITNNRHMECSTGKSQAHDIGIGNLDSVQDCNQQTNEKNEEISERIHCCCQCHTKRTSQRDCPPFANLKPGFRNSCDKTGLSGEYCIKLHSDSLRRTNEEIKRSETHKGRTKSRHRLKFTTLRRDRIDNRSHLSKPLCKKLKTVLTKNKNMTRIMCQCAILLVVCFCGGVLMVNQTPDNSNSNKLHHLPSSGLNFEDNYNWEEASNIIMDVDFTSVPKDVFEKHLARSKNAAEMLKIFFDDPNLSEDQVNSIMSMKSHQSIYGSNSKREERNHNIMNDVEDDMEEFREDAYQHHLDVSRSSFASCQDPRPEIERVYTVETNAIRTYYPSCTIVHRCRNTSGCCPRGMECGPKKDSIQIFDKYFLVLQVFETTYGQEMLRPARKNFVEARAFINHTACECNRVEINSNCHKSCPEQFSQERTTSDCECVCRHNNRVCKHMQRGLLPLEEKDLECIKLDECIKPKCHTGEFKIQSGFCPHFRKHERKRG